MGHEVRAIWAITLFAIVGIGGAGYAALRQKQEAVEVERKAAETARELARVQGELALRMQPEADVLDRLRAGWASRQAEYEARIAALGAQLAEKDQKIQVLDSVPALDPLRKLLAALQGELGNSAKISLLLNRVHELEQRKVCHCGK